MTRAGLRISPCRSTGRTGAASLAISPSITSAAGSPTLAITAVDSGGIALPRTLSALIGLLGAIEVEHPAHQGACAQPTRTPTGPPRTPTSIPISEPLAILIFAGTFDIVESISVRHEIDVWWVQLIAGIIELALGFWAAGYYGRSAILLVAWVAAFAVIRGVMSIMLAFRVREVQHAAPSEVST